MPNPRRVSFDAQARLFGLQFDYLDATPKERYHAEVFSEMPNKAPSHNLASYAHNLDVAHLLQTCLDQGTEMLLFMEDDCVLKPRALERMYYAIKHYLPPDFDLFYVGAWHQSPPVHVKFFLGKAICAYMSHCVLIHSRAMPLIIHYCLKNEQLFDIMLAEKIQALGRSYCLIPDYATQANGYSDICESYVNHTMRWQNG